jgi:nucleoside-diphosphate-sugar epimerase
MPVSGRNYVIVGGAGLLGAALGRVLSRTVEVVVCDRIGPVSRGKWANLPARMADLWTPDCLEANLEKTWRDVAGVIVLADQGHDSNDGDALFETAYHLPRRVWDFACAKQKPIFWASSLQVYGQGTPSCAMDPHVVADFSPQSPFGRAKQAFDVFAAANAKGPDKPPVATGFRLASVYGPGESHKGGQVSLPVRALERARAGKPIPLWASQSHEQTDGGHARDWVHADDAAAAMAEVILQAHAGFFDIGTGQTVSGLDVARIAGAVANAQVSVGFVTPPAGAHTGFVAAADLSGLAQAGVSTSFRGLESGLRGL